MSSLKRMYFELINSKENLDLKIGYWQNRQYSPFPTVLNKLYVQSSPVIIFIEIVHRNWKKLISHSLLIQLRPYCKPDSTTKVSLCLYFPSFIACLVIFTYFSLYGSSAPRDRLPIVEESCFLLCSWKVLPQRQEIGRAHV